MPLIHAKFAHAHFHIEPVVVVDVDTVFGQDVLLHVLVGLFATLDLGDESPLRFGKSTHEAFVPLVSVRFTALWPLSCAETEENSDFPSRPFIRHGLFERLGRGVESSFATIMEYGLAYPDRLECETD